MKKLTKLNEEQTALMSVVRDEWISRALSGRTVDREAARAGICWMYDLAKKERPNFCFVESPFGAQLAANMLAGGASSSAVRSAVGSAVDSAVRSAVDTAVYSAVDTAVGSSVGSAVDIAVDTAVDSAVGSSVGSAVDIAVHSAVDSAVYSAVHSAVRSAVYSAVRSAVDTAVDSAVDSAVRSAVYSAVHSAVHSAVFSEKARYFYTLGYAGTYWYGWAAFVDYFHRIGVIDNWDFKTLQTYLHASVWDVLLLDNGWCVVCALPSSVSRDEQGRLHNSGDAAISWRDGWKLWFLHGVQFTEELWQNVTSGQITAKEILGIENMEQRMVALKLRGPENLITELDGKLLDKSERGNELYLLAEIFDQPAYFLKYKCPSTGRVYVSGIDPEFAASHKTADECMAWKFGWEIGDYNEMRAES